MRIHTNSHFETLDDVASSTLASIDHALDEIRTQRERANGIAQRIETERQEVEHRREERELLASLDQPEGASLELGPEQQADLAVERSLIEQLTLVNGLERGLADFVSVLLAAHRQIETGSTLPDPDSANFLAIKMAELRAREDERQRFARDVHDGPAQAFANAIIGLEFIERSLKSQRESVVEDGLAEIERIKRTLREGMTEIRRFIFDHRPTMLLDRGIGPTLKHYIQSYQSIFPMIVEIEIDDSIGRLEPELELTAFRVVQESIQNASKHARASRVDVQIVKTCGDRVIVSVVDDGRGFDPERVSTHAMGGHGLKSIEERITLVGGTLRIESSRGKGTKIFFELPPQQDDGAPSSGQRSTIDPVG